jgi:hypothetical protein
MNVIVRNNQTIGLIDKEIKILDVQTMLDLMASAHYNSECVGIVLYKESLDERFFDLKTGFAGEILQKFANYNFKMAVVGDYSHYTSKSLKDFIFESNKGKLVFFKKNLEEALLSLAP